jgi:integrase
MRSFGAKASSGAQCWPAVHHLPVFIFIRQSFACVNLPEYCAGHTAGQRVLDATHGNLKAVQKLLGHSSISTTGDIYTDWDIDQLADTLSGMLEESES